ncbi:OLC1v1029893C1 [Oldenlandia corymbosa var. corymbosa]|uniref:OLC1v1029893C1 n=1 Tax=Oldenlandia corymbosa var. corymbosa TaxID=529605 RepID=A0AAV1CF24_OLDCO|nr:OLC1v1029893C1 [Oldenlandia corymbosa var. corymbosa]
MKDGVGVSNINGFVNVSFSKNGFSCDNIEALECWKPVFEKLIRPRTDNGIGMDIWSLQPLETASELRFRDIKNLNSSHWIREAIFTKISPNRSVSSSDTAKSCRNGEMVLKYKWDLIDSLEPLAEKEPREDWTEAQKHQEAIKSFYCTQSKTRNFRSTLIEADKAFHEEYKNKKGITLLPYAAWIKNSTLLFGTRNKRREYTGKIQQEESIAQDYVGEQNKFRRSILLIG